MAGPGPAIRIDRSSPVPLYFQVAEELAAAIGRGDLLPGDRLESEVHLADRLGLSRPTVRQAIGYLVDRGLVVRRRGVDTRVRQAGPPRDSQVSGLYDDLLRAGRRPSTRVLELGYVPADAEVAAALGVPVGTEVQHLRRLRLADGEPLAVMRNWLPAGLVQLTADRLQAGGLYAVLRAAGLAVRVVRQRVEARAARAAEARDLAERRGAPLLTVACTGYDDHGRVLEHGVHLHRAGRYVLEVTVGTG